MAMLVITRVYIISHLGYNHGYESGVKLLQNHPTIYPTFGDAPRMDDEISPSCPSPFVGLVALANPGCSNRASSTKVAGLR